MLRWAAWTALIVCLFQIGGGDVRTRNPSPALSASPLPSPTIANVMSSIHEIKVGDFHKDPEKFSRSRESLEFLVPQRNDVLNRADNAVRCGCGSNWNEALWFGGAVKYIERLSLQLISHTGTHFDSQRRGDSASCIIDHHPVDYSAPGDWADRYSDDSSRRVKEDNGIFPERNGSRWNSPQQRRFQGDNRSRMEIGGFSSRGGCHRRAGGVVNAFAHEVQLPDEQSRLSQSHGHQKAGYYHENPGRYSEPPFVRRFLEALPCIPISVGCALGGGLCLARRKYRRGIALIGMAWMIAWGGMGIVLLNLWPSTWEWWI